MNKQLCKTSGCISLFIKYTILYLLAFFPRFSAAQLKPGSVEGPHGKIGFYQFTPPGYNADSTYDYPLMIFLHGVGERGNGTTELPLVFAQALPQLLLKGATMKFVVNGRPHAFVILMPQMTKDYINWQNFYIDAMIDYARKNLKVDTNKVFVTGWSLGGGGAWKYATFSRSNARRVAGIILAGGSPDYTDLCNLARENVAVWAFHAIDDASVPLHFTKDAIDGINACSPLIPAQHSYFPVGGHPVVAIAAYDTLNDFQYPNMYQWMIGTTRANLGRKNLPPVALAGNDTTILVPALKVTLNGLASSDPNDVIVHYQWSLISGPPSPGLSFRNADFPVATVSGLEPGQYDFRLNISDQFGATRSDTVRVTVKLPPPGINALPAIIFIPEVNTATERCHLSCKARDFDGSIRRLEWRQISGPASVTIFPYGSQADVMGLSKAGTYRLQVTALDDHNPAGRTTDTVCITKRDKGQFIPVYFQNKTANFNTLLFSIMLSICAILIVTPAAYSLISKTEGLIGCSCATTRH